MTTLTLIGTACGLFFGCLIATAALTPAVIRLAWKVDAVDRGGYRKISRSARPLLGGLGIAAPLILLGLAAATAGYLVFSNWQWMWRHHREIFSPFYDFAFNRKDFLTFAVGGVAIVAIGLVDDARGMRARYKLLGQIVVAVFVSLSGYALTSVNMPLIGNVRFALWLGALLSTLWVVGLINAFNLIDGIDGLATGIALIGAGALVGLGIVQGNAYLTLASLAMAGCLLAFLLYNFPPAKIFLGDTGSMFLGYALATMALMGTQKSEAAAIILAPMLALGFPIFETLVSILRRYLRGAPIFVGDNRHTHHRLLEMGYSQPRVVLTLYAVALLLAAAGIISAVVPGHSIWAWCPYALYCGALIYIAWLAGYLRPTGFRKTIARRERNKVFRALGQYAALRINDKIGERATDLLLELCRYELGLRRLELCMEDGTRLMGSADDEQENETEPPQETLLVKSAAGENILIGYAFAAPPDKSIRQDISACLAAIFDEMRTD